MTKPAAIEWDSDGGGGDVGQDGGMRLVACDLDGTVVRSDHTISDRTLEAFRACERAGVDVLFVTGRPMRWMAPIVEATGHSGVAICGNGAVVYDLGNESVIEVRALTAEAVTASVSALRGVMAEVAFAYETVTGPCREADYLPHLEAAWQMPVGTVEELLADGRQVLKVLCRSSVMKADEMLARARPVLAGLAEPVHSNSADSLLELSALGVSKAATLADIAGQRGIAPSEVVAFGDMPNDVPMLHWAGRGYAMADGHPEAIAAADAIAPACDLDGVAAVIEQLLGQRYCPVE